MRWQLYRLKQTREWTVDFDYEKTGKIDGIEGVTRRTFLIRDEHVGIHGPFLTITRNDVGKVFVLDEWPDNMVDYILDPKTFPAQWRKYGGFKAEERRDLEETVYGDAQGAPPWQRKST